MASRGAGTCGSAFVNGQSDLKSVASSSLLRGLASSLPRSLPLRPHERCDVAHAADPASVDGGVLLVADELHVFVFVAVLVDEGAEGWDFFELVGDGVAQGAQAGLGLRNEAAGHGDGEVIEALGRAAAAEAGVEEVGRDEMALSQRGEAVRAGGEEGEGFE